MLNRSSILDHRFWISLTRLWKYAFVLYFAFLAFLNLLVLIEANQLALSAMRQPFDFYVLLRASSQIFSAPSQVYVWQAPTTVGAYWLNWLWDGANYAYTPMFATLLSPLSSLYPPTAKLLWEGLSYASLVASCALVVRVIPSRIAKVVLPLMVFVMPLPLLFVNQSLPAAWGSGIMPGMLISPVYFADYHFGNTNAMVLSLALFSYYFAAWDSSRSTINLKIARVPPYVLSSLFLALDTFKVTAVLFILPFWLILNRRNLLHSIALFIVFAAVLNGIIVFEPTLISGYLSKLAVEASIPTNLSPLWQVYEYVWYYTIPLAGLAFLVTGPRKKASVGPSAGAGSPRR